MPVPSKPKQIDAFTQSVVGGWSAGRAYFPSPYRRHRCNGKRGVQFSVLRALHHRRMPEHSPHRIKPKLLSDAGGCGMPELVRVPMGALRQIPVLDRQLCGVVQRPPVRRWFPPFTGFLLWIWFLAVELRWLNPALAVCPLRCITFHAGLSRREDKLLY